MVVVAGSMAWDSGPVPQEEAEQEQVGVAPHVLTEAPRRTDSEELLRPGPGRAGVEVLAAMRNPSGTAEAVFSAQSSEPPTTPAYLSSAIPRTNLLVSLPPAHGELGADGLPVSGVRCTVDGGSLRCGGCQTDSDCPAGKGCVTNRETHRLECMESECAQDLDCLPGLVCRPATPGIAGPVIHRCEPAGVRREGEPCDTLFVSRTGACEEGLVCHRGVCSTACQPGDATSCPEGFACEEGLNGAACFPDCRVQGCVEGQTCKRLNDTEYQCLASVHGQCPETPCAEGERCNMRLSRGHGVFWCAQLCNPLQADSCPTGQVCGVGGATVSTCYRQCDPMAPDSCGEGWQCTSVTEDMMRFGCRPVPQPEGVGGSGGQAGRRR